MAPCNSKVIACVAACFCAASGAYGQFPEGASTISQRIAQRLGEIDASESAAFVATKRSDSPFMLISGATATDELCLTSDGSKVDLTSCLSAVSVGDGREQWRALASGELQHVQSNKCLSGASLADCGSAGAWEFLGNGQLRQGDACLSQGGAGGAYDVAEMSLASSTSGNGGAAVDGNGATAWSAGSGASLDIDFGSAHDIDDITIDWQSPAKAFTVSTSTDGASWEVAYATTTNVVSSTRIPTSGKSASHIRVSLQGAGSISGVHANARGGAIATESCDVAALSEDARDKFFASAIGEYDASAAGALAQELPALDEARASLSKILSDIAGLDIQSCRKAAAFARAKVASLLARTGSPSVDRVDATFNFDKVAIEELLTKAKSIVA